MNKLQENMKNVHCRCKGEGLQVHMLQPKAYASYYI
jgi:hypothetical protein